MSPSMFERAVMRMRAAQRARDDKATVGRQAACIAHEAIVDDYLAEQGHALPVAAMPAVVQPAFPTADETRYVQMVGRGVRTQTPEAIPAVGTAGDTLAQAMAGVQLGTPDLHWPGGGEQPADADDAPVQGRAIPTAPPGRGPNPVQEQAAPPVANGKRSRSGAGLALGE